MPPQLQPGAHSALRGPALHFLRRYAISAASVSIPHGIYHTLVALEPGSVFFEAKAGPYAPLTSQEKAPWAPVEGEPRASSYLAELTRLFV